MQHVLTNNALALEHGMAQYTLIQDEWGGAIDDAYLYRLDEGNLIVQNPGIFSWSMRPIKRRTGVGSWSTRRGSKTLSSKTRVMR